MQQLRNMIDATVRLLRSVGIIVPWVVRLWSHFFKLHNPRPNLDRNLFLLSTPFSLPAMASFGRLGRVRMWVCFWLFSSAHYITAGEQQKISLSLAWLVDHFLCGRNRRTAVEVSSSTGRFQHNVGWWTRSKQWADKIKKKTCVCSYSVRAPKRVLFDSSRLHGQISTVSRPPACVSARRYR